MELAIIRFGRFEYARALFSRIWRGTSVRNAVRRKLWVRIGGSETLVKTVISPKRIQANTVGLRYWMLLVLEECDRVSEDFKADPVHDLRVALRRCRSLADGLISLDPEPEWKAMKKAGRQLFRRLGELRDIQVMEEWVQKIAPAKNSGAETSSLSATRENSAEPQPRLPDTPSAYDPAQTLISILSRREQEEKRQAKLAVEAFDRKQWRQWSKSLPSRAARFRLGSALFKHLALERWMEARELHARALRTRSQTAYHALRVGIKRFRYIVENFLPVEHKLWSNDLKDMQDLLGEVHDLDVLWGAAMAAQIFPNPDLRREWHKRIVTERSKRIARYSEKMVGPESLWHVWRAALPQGKQIRMIALRRMKLWASRLDPDFPHSERVAAFAMQLYDGLLASGWTPSVDGMSARSTLFTAALLHDVGKSAGEKRHHKASLELIREHGTPAGWSDADVQRAAIIARFHRGVLPTRRHKLLRDLLPLEQKTILELAAILRLANAFDAKHDGHIMQLRVANDAGNRTRRGMLIPGSGNRNGFQKSRVDRKQPLVIAAQGYSPLSSAAQLIAAERHLLETVLHRPVIVTAMKDRLSR